MFKLATLATVALVAAETSEQKYEKEGKKSLAKAKASAVTGTSKVTKHISDWEMPGHGMGTTRTVPKYSEITSDPETYCAQCIWSGGSFTPKGTDPAKCTWATAPTADDTAALDADLDFKSAFAGMSACAQQPTTGTESSDQWVLTSKSANTDGAGIAYVNDTRTCSSTWDLANFSAHPDSDKHGAHAPNSWAYSFSNMDKETTGAWCYFQTHLPASYKGGLIMTQETNTDVQYILQVDNTIERYFTPKTQKTMSIGKTGKVPLTGAKSISVMLQQKTVLDVSSDVALLTFTRASYMEMTKLVAEHGGAVVWIIIGCVVCCLIVTLACLFKCYKDRKAKENEDGDGFYNYDDLYARV